MENFRGFTEQTNDFLVGIKFNNNNGIPVEFYARVQRDNLAVSGKNLQGGNLSWILGVNYIGISS